MFAQNLPGEVVAHLLQHFLRAVRLHLPRGGGEEVLSLAVRRGVAPQGQAGRGEGRRHRTPAGRQPRGRLLALDRLAGGGAQQLLQQAAGRRLRGPARTGGGGGARRQVDDHLRHPNAHGGRLRPQPLLRRLQEHLEALVPDLVPHQERAGGSQARVRPGGQQRQ